MRRVTFWALTAALLISQAAPEARAAVGSSIANPWKDARLIHWSEEMNRGQFGRVLHEVEADLVSPAPHPFDIDIWCQLHLRQHDLKRATAAADPVLRRALGAAPRIYSLYHDGKTSQLRRLRREISTDVTGGSLIYRLLISNAIDATQFADGFDLAEKALRTKEPNFVIVWLAINLAEDDLRVRRRLEDLLTRDTEFATTPAGKALAAMVEAEKIEGATSSCRNRVAQTDRQFAKVADDWLAVYPGDAAAYQFRAVHNGDLNGDRKAIAADIDSALASYPLLHFRIGLDELLRTYFIAPDGQGDNSARLLAARWSVFDSSIPAEQRADADVLASSAMRALDGCDAAPRIETARAWVTARLASTPAAYQAPLLAELSRLDLARSEKTAHEQALKEAQSALKGENSVANTALLIQALEKTGRAADEAEARTLYGSALHEFSDHSEDFYEAGELVLAFSGTCDERMAHWRAALSEFPNAAWAMNHLAFTEAQCAQPEAARKTIAAMFEIADPQPDSLLTLQTLWSETDGFDSLDKRRGELFRAHPNQFRGFDNPPPLDKVRPSETEPRQLELVAQTPPESQMSRMAVSADGTLIAVAESDGVISLWQADARGVNQNGEMPTGCDADVSGPERGRSCPRLLRRFLADSGRIEDVRFSPNDRYLVTASEAAGSAKVWDVTTGGELWDVHTQPGIRPFVAVRPGGRGTESVAILFRLPRNASQGLSPVSGWSELVLCDLDPAGTCSTESWYSNTDFGSADSGALAWSADGKQLLTRVSNRETLIIDAQTMRLVRDVESHAGAAYSSDLSSELYADEDTGESVLLKTHTLGPESRPATVASVQGTLLGKRYLDGGKIRLAIQTVPQSTAPAGSGAAGMIQILDAEAARPDEKIVPTAKVIASIPVEQFPDPVLQFSAAVPERLTVLSHQAANVTGTTRAFAVGYLSLAAKNGIDLDRLPSHLPPVPNSIAFSADDRELFVGRGSGDETRLDVWDLSGQGRPATLAHKLAVGPTVAVAQSRLWTCAQVGPSTYGIVSYELPAFNEASTGNPPCNPEEGSVVAGSDGAVAWQSGTDHITVTAVRGMSWNIPSIANLDVVKAMAVRGDTVLAVTEAGVYEQRQGSPAVNLCDALTDCPPEDASFAAVALSTDAHYAAVAIGPAGSILQHSVPAPGKGYGVLVIDLAGESARLHQQLSKDGYHSAVTTVAFLPKSSRYVVGTVTGRMFWGDAADPSFSRPIGADTAPNSPVTAIAFSPDGRLLAVALESGSVMLFQMKPEGSMTEVAQLNSFEDGDWSVVNRTTQQYDAAHSGMLGDLLWVYGTSTIELNQMIANYYRGHLLPKLLSFDTIPVRPSPKLDTRRIDLPPNIRIVSMTPDLVLTADTSIAQLYRAHKVRVLVNNSPVNESEMKIGNDGLLHVIISAHHTYAPGRENTVSVFVDNGNGTIDSRGFGRTIQDKSAPPSSPPKQFYAIVAGISNYATAGDLPPLPLADADARSMALAIARGAGHLVGDPSHVHIYLLSSDKQRGRQTVADLQKMGVTSATWRTPSHANFLATFREVGDSHLRADDMFVLYLGGHGMEREQGGQEQYMFPTKEMADVEQPVPGSYLSEQELQRGLQDIGASHTILLFDTCDAGQFRDDTLRADSMAGMNHRAFADSILALMGAASDAKAYDSPRVGHGFLTNSLLAGMRESLDDEKLYAYAWLEAASARTWEIARLYGLNQQPIPMGQDEHFEIAELPRDEEKCIPDVEVLPLVGRPDFRGAQGADDLGLSDALVNFWSPNKDHTKSTPVVLYYDGTSSARIQTYGDYSTGDGQLKMDVHISYPSSPMAEFHISVPFQTDSPDVNVAVQTIARHVESYARELAVSRKPWTPPSSCFAPLTAMK